MRTKHKRTKSMIRIAPAADAVRALFPGRTGAVRKTRPATASSLRSRRLGRPASAFLLFSYFFYFRADGSAYMADLQGKSLPVSIFPAV
jgi:hypothetical protein